MRTSREWREYYEQNAASLLDIPWNVGGDLTQVERQAIASSLQGFRLANAPKVVTCIAAPRSTPKSPVTTNTSAPPGYSLRRSNGTHVTSHVSWN